MEKLPDAEEFLPSPVVNMVVREPMEDSVSSQRGGPHRVETFGHHPKPDYGAVKREIHRDGGTCNRGARGCYQELRTITTPAVTLATPPP